MKKNSVLKSLKRRLHQPSNLPIDFLCLFTALTDTQHINTPISTLEMQNPQQKYREECCYFNKNTHQRCRYYLNYILSFSAPLMVVFWRKHPWYLNPSDSPSASLPFCCQTGSWPQPLAFQQPASLEPCCSLAHDVILAAQPIGWQQTW